MDRREFCRLIAMAGAAAALPRLKLHQQKNEIVGWHGSLPGLRLSGTFKPVPALTTWSAEQPFTVGQRIVDANGNIQEAAAGGVSGMVEPAWRPRPLLITTKDGGITWMSVGRWRRMYL